MKSPGNFRYLVAAIVISPIIGVLLGSLMRDILLIFIMDFESWLHNLLAFIESGVAATILGLVFSLPVVLFYSVPVFYRHNRRMQPDRSSRNASEAAADSWRHV